MTTEGYTTTNTSTSDEEEAVYNTYSYLDDPVYKHVVKAAVSLGLLGLLSNGFVLVVMLGYVKIKSRLSTLLVVHQTVADAVCSANVLITYTLWFTVNGKLEGLWGDVLCKVFINETLFWIGLMLSVFSLTIIIFERFLMVVHPIFHRNHFTKRVVAILLLIDWLAAFGFLAPMAFYSEVQYGWCIVLTAPEYIDEQTYTKCFTVGTFIIPVGLLIYGSWKTTRTLITRTRTIQAVGTETGGGERLSKSQVNITVTMVVVVVVFLVCFTPYQMALACYSFGIISYDANIFGPVFVVCLITCCINPFIYAVKYEVFKVGIRKMLRIAIKVNTQTNESTIGKTSN